jgi:maintenance of mitochondrial morphology protein 1
MDVDLTDVITLGIETTLHLNYPKPSIAILPVSLSVSLIKFTASLSISFIPRPPLPLAHSESPTTTALTFTFAPDFNFDLSVRSLVGARSRLQDIPKIAQLVEGRVRLWFVERCVQPRYQRVVLPNFWPSRAKEGSRAGEDEEEGEGEGTVRDEEDEVAVESGEEEGEEKM